MNGMMTYVMNRMILFCLNILAWRQTGKRSLNQNKKYKALY